VAVVWERYRDTGTETVAVDLLDWSAPTGPAIAASWAHDGFSPAADLIACGDQLIDARIDAGGRGVRLAVLDEHLRPVATAHLDVTASEVAVGLVGETVMVVVADAEQRIRCSQWDRSLRSIADDLIVAGPVAARISALHVVGSGERLAIAHLVTMIGDATSAGLRDARILGPPPRSTVELVTILRPGGGTIPPPIELRPPSAGPSPMCWVDERLWVLHGSGVPALSVVAP
jgi:hypothetical protein